MALSTGNLLNFKFITAAKWATRGENPSLTPEELASSDIIFIEATKQMYGGGVYIGVSPEQATQLSNLLNDVNTLKSKVGSNEQISRALFQIVEDLKSKLDGGTFETGGAQGATIAAIDGQSYTDVVSAINALNTLVSGFTTGVASVNGESGVVELDGSDIDTTAAAGSMFGQQSIDTAFKGVQSNIDGIQSKLDTEISTRGTAISGVQSQIGAEKTARETAISGVQGQFNTKIGDFGSQSVKEYVDNAAEATLAGAQANAEATAKAYVDELAGTDWTTAAKTVQDIITELSEDGNADFTTVVDKVRGDFRYEGAPEGQQSIKGYIDHAVSVGSQGAQGAAGTAETNAKTYADEQIQALDGVQADTDTANHIYVKVTQTDGQITGVQVDSTDIASAEALGGAQTRITNVENQLKWTVV